MHLVLIIPEAFSFHYCVSLSFPSAPRGSETLRNNPGTKEKESVLPASAGVFTKCEDLFLQRSASASSLVLLVISAARLSFTNISE